MGLPAAFGHLLRCKGMAGCKSARRHLQGDTQPPRADRARVDERDKQVPQKMTSSQWCPFPRGTSIMNPLRSAGLTPGSELAAHFTLGKLRGTQTSVSSRSSREAGLHHGEKKSSRGSGASRPQSPWKGSTGGTAGTAGRPRPATASWKRTAGTGSTDK